MSNASLQDFDLISEFNRKSPDHQQLNASLRQKSLTSAAIYFEESKQGLSLLELMGLTTFAAVGIAAVVNLGLIGALISFLIAGVWSIAIRAKGLHPGKIRFLTQLIWGIMMPLVCLLADPYFFATIENGRPIEFNETIAAPAYISHLILFGVLILSVFINPRSFSFIHSYLSGSMMSFGLMFFVLGFCLIPGVLIGSLALVGLVGLSPWITGVVLIKSSAMHGRWASGASRLNRIFLWSLGFITPLALWIGTVSAAGNGAFDACYEMLVRSR